MLHIYFICCLHSISVLLYFSKVSKVNQLPKPLKLSNKQKHKKRNRLINIIQNHNRFQTTSSANSLTSAILIIIKNIPVFQYFFINFIFLKYLITCFSKVCGLFSPIEEETLFHVLPFK